MYFFHNPLTFSLFTHILKRDNDNKLQSLPFIALVELRTQTSQRFIKQVYHKVPWRWLNSLNFLSLSTSNSVSSRKILLLSIIHAQFCCKTLLYRSRLKHRFQVIKECCLLGSGVVSTCIQVRQYQSNVLPSTSGWKNELHFWSEMEAAGSPETLKFV